MVYFKLRSKSDFFKQDRISLAVWRDRIDNLLIIKVRSKKDIEDYLKAYDFFCKNYKKFDGATFVKDLNDIPILDLDAMLHDYKCLIGANRSYKLWYIETWNYFENMRKNGKGNQILRALGLCVIGVVFVPYCYLFTNKYK